jgi:hypothetical protein
LPNNTGYTGLIFNLYGRAVKAKTPSLPPGKMPPCPWSKPAVYLISPERLDYPAVFADDLGGRSTVAMSRNVTDGDFPGNAANPFAAVRLAC